MANDIKLPNMERVRILGGLHPLMEIADPNPELFIDKLAKAQLAQVLEVGIKYRIKLIEVEKQALDAQAAALTELRTVVKGLK